jgi:hypothetical protein
MNDVRVVLAHGGWADGSSWATGPGAVTDRGVIDSMGLDFRPHALGHEALGGRRDHMIMRVSSRGSRPTASRRSRRRCH